jgi:aspartyl-tRNA(Asn)/glutamyl-tRNA(Gln) amidotransferase subunit C
LSREGVVVWAETSLCRQFWLPLPAGGTVFSSAMHGTPQLDIDYVAELARLALTADEKREFSRQLGDILGYVEKLKEVDVAGVEPTAHAFEVVNVWQEDVPSAPLPVEKALQNAPAVRDGMIVVPKVVDEA